jgi:hypothetical protein
VEHGYAALPGGIRLHRVIHEQPQQVGAAIREFPAEG